MQPEKLKPQKEGAILLDAHPLFKDITTGFSIAELPKEIYFRFSTPEHVTLNKSQSLRPPEWAYIYAYSNALLYFDYQKSPYAMTHPTQWWTACSYFTHKFLREMKLFKAPEEFQALPACGHTTVEKLFNHFRSANLVPADFLSLNPCAISDYPKYVIPNPKPSLYYVRHEWSELFGRRLREQLLSTMDSLHRAPVNNLYTKAKELISNKFPMLGALAIDFKINTDSDVCKAKDIRIAAVSTRDKTIYFNPGYGLTSDQCLFIMAHELLHVALCHTQRQGYRDPYIWNIACDYVINHWLIEMKLGTPIPGLMHDPTLKDESAENVYDLLVRNTRALRKLSTMRNNTQSDLLDEDGWSRSEAGVSLDKMYRELLSRSLDYQISLYGAGSLPAGLVEEIRSLAQPPIPWDVKLSAWFDIHFTPEEKHRSYAHASRRQSATPDIPRAAWTSKQESKTGHTLAVLLDTSGSMSQTALGNALGSIASFALSKDVEQVRLIFCDAHPYDGGFIDVNVLANQVSVQGRGGTILQPGLDLLDSFTNLPVDAPVLIITDGQLWERNLTTSRSHAYLLPENASLPFTTSSPIFNFA